MAFFLYSNFILDYSLEDLAIAVQGTENDYEQTSPLVHKVYQRHVNEMAMEEAASEETDFRNLVLLELASRSFGEFVDRAGYVRARFYLNLVSKSKIPKRNSFLRALDAIFRETNRLYQSIFRLLSYIQKRFFPKLPEMKEPYEYSSILLLNQAEEKEKNWQLDEAAELYRKYLKNYLSRPDRAYVAISLAHILIRQKKNHEAERLLRNVEVAFAGQEEGKMASSLLRKLDSMKKREILIYQLQREIPAFKGTPRGDQFEFKLALAYLSTYRFTQAETYFRELENSRDEEIRQKAKFYRAWMLKLSTEFGEGEKMILDLMQDPEIDRELGLGLQAELADIYYQQKNVDEALKIYESLSRTGEEGELSHLAAQEAWVALAEIEQANIYFDKEDSIRGNFHLEKAKQQFPHNVWMQQLGKAYKEVSEINLLSRAFRALRQRNIHLAYDLFKRNLLRHPRDAWTHSGVATVYVLLGELNEAENYASKGFELKRDEYTSSVLAYVEGFLLHFDLSIQHYLAALNLERGYIPARYNLACGYLKAGQFSEAHELLNGLEAEFDRVRNVMRSKILNNQGYALWSMGSKEKAREYFRQSMTITPGFPDAKRNLTLAQRQQPPHVISMKEL